MAGSSKTGLACITLLATALLCQAEPTITLSDAAARKLPDYTLVNDGAVVVVSGQVSTKPVRIGDVFHLAIQEHGHGLVLEGSAKTFAQTSPGDWVEAHGKISQRAGLPILIVSKIVTVSNGAPPLPLARSPADIQDFDHVGQLLVTQGEVIEVGSNFGGAYLRIGTSGNALKVYLPSSADSRRAFAGFPVGEIVRVTGIGYQYCPIPPYVDQFELLIDENSDVVRLGGNRMSQLRALWPILAALGIVGFFWWRREITSRKQRELLRIIYQLGEDILSSASSPEILDKITLVLPKVLRVTAARLYLYDRGSNTLNPVADPPAPGIPIDAPSGLLQTSVVDCFRNRKLLSIPDTRRHPTQASGADKGRQPGCRARFFLFRCRRKASRRASFRSRTTAGPGPSARTNRPWRSIWPTRAAWPSSCCSSDPSASSFPGARNWPRSAG